MWLNILSLKKNKAGSNQNKNAYAIGWFVLRVNSSISSFSASYNPESPLKNPDSLRDWRRRRSRTDLRSMKPLWSEQLDPHPRFSFSDREVRLEKSSNGFSSSFWSMVIWPHGNDRWRCSINGCLAAIIFNKAPVGWKPDGNLRLLTWLPGTT